MINYEYVILGGGVAGLCAAKRLLELGLRPLVIEAGSYPAHKVCGEFISPSSLPLLKKWNIHPIPITQVEWHTPTKHLNFSLQSPAGSLSHLTLDSLLADQISAQGATLATQTQVVELVPASAKNGLHQLTLSSGTRIQTQHLLIATGRLPHPSQKKLTPRYKGFKAHFSGLDLKPILHMFSFPGAYLGIVPVENGRANLACLAKMECVQPFSSADEFMERLINFHPILRSLVTPGCREFEHWMEASVPEFQLKSNPNWPGTYWIGDAASTIPPASGNGLSLAIASGYMAAEYAVKKDPEGFKQYWKKRCTPQIRLAKGLHRVFLNPELANAGMILGDWFPSFPGKCFEFTRDSGIKDIL